MRSLIAIHLLFAALFAAQPLAAQAVDQQLPEDTLLLVTAPDLKASWGHFKQTTLWEIWQDASVQRFYEKLRGLAEQQADQADQLKELRKLFKDNVGIELEALPDVFFKGRFAFAIIDFAIPADGPPRVDVVLTLDYDAADPDKRFEKLLKFGLAQLKEKSNGQAQVTETKIEGMDVTQITAEGAPFTVNLGTRDGRFYLTSNEETMKRVLEGSTAGTKLADNANYKAARAGIDATKEIGFSFLNIKAALAKFAPQIPPDAQKIIETVGANGIEAIAGSASIEDKDIVERLFIGMPGERKGITKILTLPKITMKGMRYVPANTALFSCAGFDIAGLYAEGVRLFKELNPQGVEEFDQGKAQVEEKLGVKLEALVAALGTEVTSFSRLDRTVPPTGNIADLMHFCYALELKDAAVVDAAMGKIFEMAGVPVKTEEHHGVKVHTIEVPQGEDVPVKDFALAIHEGTLLFAMPAADLVATLKDAAAGSTPSHDDLRAHLARHPENLSGFGVIDLATYARALWAVAKPMVMEGLKEGAPIKGEDLPDVDALLAKLGPMTSSVQSDATGTRLAYRSPVGIFSIAIAGGVGAAVAMPAMNAAKSRAQGAGCVAKLKQIGIAMQAYKTDAGKFPEDFSELIGDKKYLDPASRPFVSPADPTPLREGELETSYIYIYANALGEKDAATTIVAYNRSPLMTGSRNVLYLDGHVESVDDESFRGQFEKQKEALKKHGIQVFIGWGKTK